MEAFHDLIDMERISFTNVTFGEISTRAVSNVSVRHFLITGSELRRIDYEAFDLTVGNTFAIERTQIEHIEDNAFFDIRAKDPSAPPVISLVNVSVLHKEEDALKFQDHFQIGEGTNIAYNKSCSCDWGSKSHKPVSPPPLESQSNLKFSSDMILNFIYCEHDGTSIPWSKFDVEHCDEDHDHTGDGIYIPNILGIDKNIFLGIVIGAGVIFVLGRLLQFGNQLKMLIIFILSCRSGYFRSLRLSPWAQTRRSTPFADWRGK